METDTKSEAPQFTIDSLKSDDIASLQPILQRWVRDGLVVQTDEIREINERLEDYLAGTNSYTYLVARDRDGVAIGMMGIRPPEEGMLRFADTANPAELVNAFMSYNARGKGIGKALLLEIFKKAQALGYTEVMLNSGPRYEHSAWDFYNHIFGEPLDVAHNYYGDGNHAPVWRKVF